MEPLQLNPGVLPRCITFEAQAYLPFLSCWSVRTDVTVTQHHPHFVVLCALVQHTGVLYRPGTSGFLGSRYVMEIVASPKLKPSLSSTLGSPLRVQRKPFGSLLTGALRSPNPRFTKRPLSPVDCESQHNIGGAVATKYVAKPGAVKCQSDAKCVSTNELIHGRLDLQDFNVGKAIGKGRFGNVYLASAKGLDGGEVNGPLAIKMVSKLQLELASTDSSSVFKKEVGILQSLVHKHIVRLYG
jgi:hypothetical protein